MKLYLIIMPQDYQLADAEVYKSRKEAEKAKQLAIENDEQFSENWFIKEVEI